MTIAEWRAAAEDRIEPEPNSGCWLWVGPIAGPGYGMFYYRNERRYAHRVTYEAAHGPIPDGREIDHLCRVRRCVNPAHLEAVTHRENLVRGEGFVGRQTRQTECKRGHPLVAGNIYTYQRGHRACRECILSWRREQYRSMKDNA